MEVLCKLCVNFHVFAPKHAPPPVGFTDVTDLGRSQIVVKAWDLGTPQRPSQDSATVTVRVQRNKNCPQFQQEPFTKTIQQTKSVRSEVMKITAVDYDPQNTPFRKLNFTLLGDDKGPTYFRIDENTGRIYVKTDLRADTEIQYKVRKLLT